MGNAVQHSQFDSDAQFTTTAGAAALLATLAVAAPARAHDINDKLSVNGVVAGVRQCQEISNDTGTRDACNAAIAFQPEITFNGEGLNTGFVKLGLAGGNGLSPVSPFALAPWAADLQADVKNINGRPRDHILIAWYRRRLQWGANAQAGLTGGIIDATDYLDDNAFANDEYTQFMNQVFVNAPTAGLPSYEWGAVGELDHGPWSARAVVINVGENDDDDGYTFYGGQVAVTATTRAGQGTYRLVAAGTDDQFFDPAGTARKGLSSLTFSADQQLGYAVGVFVRLGWQDDAAAVPHDAFYSGGGER